MSSSKTSALAAIPSSSSLPSSPSFSLRKPLPEKVLLAYTTNQCHNLNDMAQVTTAIESGVNVLIWVFLAFEPISNLRENPTKERSSSTGIIINPGNDHNIQRNNPLSSRIRMKSELNVENYKLYRRKLEQLGYTDVVHLVAFGGWNGPHLPSGYTSTELYEAFQLYNTQQQKKMTKDESDDNDYNDVLFDGIDWDIEGHDNVESPNNEFTKECLDAMGELSELAKLDGYIVSMAPPESYLDITTSKFSRFVNLTYPEPWHQDFQYHGANVYAYILAKWSHAIDFIFLQFYESYSHAAYNISQIGQQPSSFLVEYVSSLVDKEEQIFIHFEDDPSVELDNQFVSIPLSKLILGFANGWALNDKTGAKTVFFCYKSLQTAYNELDGLGRTPRGMGFWVVEEEGKHGVNYAKDLDEILKTGQGSKVEDIAKTSLEYYTRTEIVAIEKAKKKLFKMLLGTKAITSRDLS